MAQVSTAAFEDPDTFTPAHSFLRAEMLDTPLDEHQSPTPHAAARGERTPADRQLSLHTAMTIEDAYRFSGADRGQRAEGRTVRPPRSAHLACHAAGVITTRLRCHLRPTFLNTRRGRSRVHSPGGVELRSSSPAAKVPGDHARTSRRDPVVTRPESSTRDPIATRNRPPAHPSSTHLPTRGRRGIAWRPRGPPTRRPARVRGAVRNEP